MKNKRIIRKVLYYILGIFFFFVIGGGIFLTFFFQDFIDAHLNAKLKEATRTSTHGLFRLEVGKIRYAHGTMYCTRVELIRARYDKSESGLTMKSLIADSVYFEGLHIFDVLFGKGLFLEKMSAASPQVFLGDVIEGREELRNSVQDTSPFSTTMPKGLPVISYDSITLSNISLHIPTKFAPPGIDSLYSGISIRLSKLRIDDSVLNAQPILFCKGIDLKMINFPFDLADSSYQLSIAGMHASLEDSLITIDSFNFHSRYSGDAFAAKYKYATPMLSFHCSGIRSEGISLGSSLSQGPIVLRKFIVSSFYLDSYEDNLHPKNPHPKPVMFPNELLYSIPGSLLIDSIILDKGIIRLRERWRGGTGVIGFDKVRIMLSPIVKDSVNRNIRPTKITINARFLNEAPFNAELSYPLFQKEFDMHARVTVGSFSALRLNPWLVPVERMKVESGVLKSGSIDMTIHAGKSNTKVLPYYSDFVVKLLPSDPHVKSGLAEKIKTLAISAFVIRRNNPNLLGSSKIGLTEYSRIKTEEFFQFLWFAIRKSLEKVVG